MELVAIFISAILINNFVLHYFLGICPFLGVSKRIDSAFSMGLAVTFVMTITAIVSWIINHWVLIPYNLDYLQIVSFILVIASLVQLVEMFIRKTSPPLYQALGIYLPLITTNCAILGLALLAALKNYSFIETIIFGLGSGIGFTLAIVLMAGIREQLDMADVPEVLKGPGIALITAGIMALGFLGFTGMLK
ncbi:electron transport complex subunit RsxA [Candidatus Aminicenantes bacterium AC-335-K20]|nr:electron transport complex subunit RsxA [SCandidatus Aminicenantes bacterium Aminicenantia_JdfR_composite]MCP2605505.1 electron transport complex subunit RsxA [Candidatus Aminicenantes bacterium AC-335-O07]MCP2618948.1 electron transport complex subunit RsxA [Candidatus Aminicenantes bacterium AC-335-A11]MCP2619182.1 electron transport complex subunit RsxA [Candidatus Aminicenantes bacterium AC-335-K20]MCP2620637.1 electron transport complex subunit RsxA [Candidatus Aminicenantes bacterium A